MKRSHKAMVWFRRDLRLADHPALLHACENYDEVIPVFIWSSDEEGKWRPGEAGRWWLHHSLTALQKDFISKRSKIVIRKGRALDVLQDLLTETKASAVYWNRLYEPEIQKRDQQIERTLKKAGYQTKAFNGSLLYEPFEIKNKQGKPYRVFTPFWNALKAGSPPAGPLGMPRDFRSPKKWPSTLPLQDLKLEPEINWAEGFAMMWKPGRKGASQKLNRFKKSAAEYENTHNRPDQEGTSRLSPHIHFGEISPREIWAALSKERRPEPYLRQIAWREFANHLLHYFPHTPEKPLDEKFERFKWQRHQKYLRAWKKGQTGYPIVDAGMRELWHTGWMHNRVRMIVASFLVKDLMISWQRGAEWFWDTLVDADLANNTMGWQWVAGCGADAAPFFRIFNPVSQGGKFDPKGDYVRKWVPEIAGLPNKWIHQPWEAPEDELKKAQIKIGKDYPKPVVDHVLARRQALFAYEEIRT